LNYMLYQFMMQQWGHMSDFDEGSAMLTKGISIGLVVETVLFFLAFVWMAKATSHRIAGPYIGLQKTCERIRDGELDCRQHFRSYDHLEELQQAFNEMVDTLCEQPDETET